MVTNNDFIQDERITNKNIGSASLGELDALREILLVFADYIDQPVPQDACNMAPQSPENKQREMKKILPFEERKSSIKEFIDLIDKGEIVII
jgi:hypothetical protein